MSRFMSVPIAVLVVSLMCIPCALAGTSPQTVNEKFQMPVHLSLNAAATGCTNAPGPQITLSGEFGLGGLGVELIFRNNEDGTHTHTEEKSVEATLVPTDESLTFPKQPVIGGIGGNPFIWIQLTDAQGRPMTSELFLGRCVQGVFKAEADFVMPVVAMASMSTSSCSNAPGPYITLDGGMELSGINGKLILRNNDNPAGGPHMADDAMATSVVLLPMGQAIQFPKQPVIGGVGGNPWIWLQFMQGDGTEIGDENLMGRCVQSSK